MTYFDFLITFLIPPVILLFLITYIGQRRSDRLPPELRAANPWIVVLILIAVAVIYTTPWDNYLVATKVWWYDPALVTGVTIGWVPLEEYIFFVLQTAMTGLLTVVLGRHIVKSGGGITGNRSLRIISTALILILWLCAGIAFFLINPARYTSLLFLWALPPIALQLAFGADILWYYRRWVSLSIFLPTVYLAVADSLAIGLGTWTINPNKSFNLFICSLPIEELLFFLCTNTLVVFGTVLAISVPGHARLMSAIDQVRKTRRGASRANMQISPE